MSDPLRFEESGDELRDEEYPDCCNDDDLAETVSCPECGAVVYEDAQQCPVCGTYIIHRADVFAGRPAWWIVLAVLGVLAIIVALAVW